MAGQLPRTRVRLVVVVVVLVAATVLIGLLVAHHRTSTPGAVTSRPPDDAPPAPVQDPAEVEVVTRSMTPVPAEAAWPHPLTTASAGPAIDIPAPGQVTGTWIPSGFPSTPEGALGQLKAFNETALQGGDPAVYDRAYAEFALPGAPTVDGSGLHTLLARFRDSAGIAPGAVKPGLSVDYDVTFGLIKGSLEDGRFTVVCTLGQLSVDVQGRSTTFGVGDCQAMRWTGTAWRISAGARAAYAPVAWPGSLDAVKAGYCALSGEGAR